MKIRIIVRVVIYNKGKVLLVRNKGENFWYPPGGEWEYKKEKIIEAALREVKEEVGLKVKIERFLYLQEFYPKPGLIFFEIFWLAKLLSGKSLNHKHVDLDPNGQVEIAVWYSKDDLKNLKVFPKRLKTTFWNLRKIKSENPFMVN
jgi:8-oxo-dGTP diphosphatase